MFIRFYEARDRDHVLNQLYTEVEQLGLNACIEDEGSYRKRFMLLAARAALQLVPPGAYTVAIEVDETRVRLDIQAVTPNAPESTTDRVGADKAS